MASPEIMAFVPRSSSSLFSNQLGRTAFLNFCFIVQGPRVLITLSDKSTQMATSSGRIWIPAGLWACTALSSTASRGIVCPSQSMGVLVTSILRSIGPIPRLMTKFIEKSLMSVLLLTLCPVPMYLRRQFWQEVVRLQPGCSRVIRVAFFWTLTRTFSSSRSSVMRRPPWYPQSTIITRLSTLCLDVRRSSSFMFSSAKWKRSLRGVCSYLRHLTASVGRTSLQFAASLVLPCYVWLVLLPKSCHTGS